MDPIHPRQHTHDFPGFSRPSTPEIHVHTIGFVGLGAMGYLMARNLATHRSSHPAGSPPLLVYNRSLDKCEQLQKELGPNKVRIAQSYRQIAEECDIIITSLANDTVVKSVYEEFSTALKETPVSSKKIFVEASTIYPSLAGELDSLISSHPRCSLITSPVFGPPAAADKSQLIIIMAGDYASKKECAYVLVPAVGKKVVDLGGNLEKACTFKLIGNSLILGSLELLAESFTVAEKAGIGARAVHSLIKDLLPAPPLIAYGEKMITDAFDGTKGFAIDGGIKDATHIRRLTADLNAPMPLIDTAHQHLLTARALHEVQEDKTYNTLDWSGLVAATRVAAGLDPFDSQKHTKVVRDESQERR